MLFTSVQPKTGIKTDDTDVWTSSIIMVDFRKTHTQRKRTKLNKFNVYSDVHTGGSKAGQEQRENLTEEPHVYENHRVTHTEETHTHTHIHFFFFFYLCLN